MPEPRHLKSAPITEAIVDIRVKAQAGINASVFSGLRQTLADRFPEVDERRGGQVTIRLYPAPSQPVAVDGLDLQGFLFKSADGKLIAQYRIDGLTLNRLRPYTSWNELFPLAMELWNKYCEVAPQAITRLALRYINHVHLPPDLATCDPYRRAGPIIPAELPQYTSAFLMRVTIHDQAKGVAAHVVQALEATPATRAARVILDIDAFREVFLRPGEPAIQDIFRDLRHFKNLIFFNYLTEETIRRFE